MIDLLFSVKMYFKLLQQDKHIYFVFDKLVYTYSNEQIDQSKFQWTVEFQDEYIETSHHHTRLCKNIPSLEQKE